MNAFVNNAFKLFKLSVFGVSESSEPPVESYYLRPDGTSYFLRPDGTSLYKRP
jgi:hypothetical protein